MKTWFPLSLPCFEWAVWRMWISAEWSRRLLESLTNWGTQIIYINYSYVCTCPDVWTSKGLFFFFKSIFTSFKCIYIIYYWNPDNLQIEALWKVWRAWIILNCSVHGSELIYFTSWRTLSISKHFNNSESKDVPLGIILYLNFDCSHLKSWLKAQHSEN